MKLNNNLDKELTLLFVPLICEPFTVPPVRIDTEYYGYWCHLELADSFGEGLFWPDMLVSADYYWDLMTGETIRGNKGPGNKGPVAVCTHLGFVFSGPVVTDDSTSCSTNLVTYVIDASNQCDEASLHETLKSFWKLEALGVQPKEEDLLSEPINTICFKEGRYEVGLPWKQLHPVLPDNYALSQKQLQGPLKRSHTTTKIWSCHSGTDREGYHWTCSRHTHHSISQPLLTPPCCCAQWQRHNQIPCCVSHDRE